MNFGAIIIGDEILSGKRADKHLAKLIELLSARGLALAHADTLRGRADRCGMMVAMRPSQLLRETRVIVRLPDTDADWQRLEQALIAYKDAV